MPDPELADVKLFLQAFMMNAAVVVDHKSDLVPVIQRAIVVILTSDIIGRWRTCRGLERTFRQLLVSAES